MQAIILVDADASHLTHIRSTSNAIIFGVPVADSGMAASLLPICLDGYTAIGYRSHIIAEWCDRDFNLRRAGYSCPKERNIRLA